MNRESKLIQIANYYGEKAQLDQTIEEMAELIQAINKRKRSEFNCKIAKDMLKEEVADVEIMLEQLKILTMTDNDIQDIEGIKDAKIQRTMNKINKEKSKEEVTYIAYFVDGLSQCQREEFWEDK